MEDCARAFLTAATADTVSFDRYLVGTNQQATLVEIIDIIQTRLPDADLELDSSTINEQWIGDRNNHPPTDSTRIRTDLGWEPEYDLSEMVTRYIEWLLANPDQWSFTAADIPWTP